MNSTGCGTKRLRIWTNGGASTWFNFTLQARISDDHDGWVDHGRRKV